MLLYLLCTKWQFCIVPVDWWSEGLLPFFPQPDDKKVDAFQQRLTQLHLHGAKGQTVTMTTPHLCVLWSIWTPDLAHLWLEISVLRTTVAKQCKVTKCFRNHKQCLVYSSIIFKRRVGLTHYKPHHAHTVVLYCFIQKCCNLIWTQCWSKHVFIFFLLWNTKGDT